MFAKDMFKRLGYKVERSSKTYIVYERKTENDITEKISINKETGGIKSYGFSSNGNRLQKIVSIEEIKAIEKQLEEYNKGHFTNMTKDAEGLIKQCILNDRIRIYKNIVEPLEVDYDRLVNDFEELSKEFSKLKKKYRNTNRKKIDLEKELKSLKEVSYTTEECLRYKEHLRKVINEFKYYKEHHR